MKFLLELYDAGRGMAADTELWLMKRAAKGDRLAMPALARLFPKDHGVRRELAVRYLKKTMQKSKGGPRHLFDEYAARFELGMRYLKGPGFERNDALAARWLEREAEDLHEEASFMMGHLYREGRGVGQSAAEAIRWYRKACARSDVKLFEDEATAREYIDARRRTADGKAWAAAHALLREEAKRGSVDACFALGIFYLDGIGVAENPERAAFWIKKAARAGDAEAQYLFGNLAEQGIGMARNPKVALRWHEKAAEKAAWFSEYVERFDEDDKGKGRWLKRQSRKGNPFAQYEFACSYCKNPVRRAALLRQPAEQGNLSAQYRLGLAYCSGEGVKQDYAQAAYWLQRASVNPEPGPHIHDDPGLPQRELAHLYREGKGVARDPVLAAHWYETSLDESFSLALAMAYECGRGVEADREKARYLYAASGKYAASGNFLAAFFLELMDDPAVGVI
jgi:TPR repeat protein